MEIPLKLKRYTKIENLLDIINTRKIKFSNPNKWINLPDRNDIELLNIYREKMGAKEIFVLCFSSKDETIHFWTQFARGKDGCCINFNVKYLIEVFKSNDLIHKKVSYEKIKIAKENEYTLADIPFMKRWPYRIENEYRAIWLSTNDSNDYEIDINLKQCIKSIVVNNDTTDDRISEIKLLWKEKTGKNDLHIHRTTVLKNIEWINYFRKLVK